MRRKFKREYTYQRKTKAVVFNKTRFAVGSTVALIKGKKKDQAKIVSFIFDPSIQGGVVLDRQLQGFRLWNLEDLVLIIPMKS